MQIERLQKIRCMARTTPCRGMSQQPGIGLLADYETRRLKLFWMSYQKTSMESNNQRVTAWLDILRNDHINFDTMISDLFVSGGVNIPIIEAVFCIVDVHFSLSGFDSEIPFDETSLGNRVQKNFGFTFLRNRERCSKCCCTSNTVSTDTFIPFFQMMLLATRL